MLPKVILHNTVSLDGSIKDFEVHLGIHYQVARKFKAEAHLIGSITAKTGIHTFNDRVPREKKSDRVKLCTTSGDERPLWVIPDSRGILKNLLHVFRRSGYCKDVIVFTSMKTPKNYLEYLREREYDFFIVGNDHVDYHQALGLLYTRYDVRTVLTDTGGILGSILLERGLVDEISLLITPVLVGKNATYLFRILHHNVTLELIKSEIYDENYMHLLYKIEKGEN